MEKPTFKDVHFSEGATLELDAYRPTVESTANSQASLVVACAGSAGTGSEVIGSYASDLSALEQGSGSPNAPHTRRWLSHFGLGLLHHKQINSHYVSAGGAAGAGQHYQRRITQHRGPEDSSALNLTTLTSASTSSATSDKLALYTMPLDQFYRELGTDPQRGITSHEAASRLARDGPNQLKQARHLPRMLTYVDKCPMLII